MKGFFILIALLILVACGKKTTNDEETTVRTTPGINISEPDEYIISNHQFSLTTDKSVYNLNDVIVITVENIGGSALNHLAFTFSASPSEVQVTRLNCFDILTRGEKCSFAAVFLNPQSGPHVLSVHYEEYDEVTSLELEIDLEGIDTNPTHEFLYKGFHTMNDCKSAPKLNKAGEISQIGNEYFCDFRGPNYYADSTTKIVENPLSVFNTNSEEPNNYYCAKGFQVNSFKFESSTVEEHTNYFGGRKDVVIPAGESREICTKRSLFSCKEKTVYYSRLTKVQCY